MALAFIGVDGVNTGAAAVSVGDVFGTVLKICQVDDSICAQATYAG